MTDGIGRIFGGNSYGVGGYVPNRKNEENPETKAEGQQVNNFEETQVDPNKILDFMANNNYFVDVAKAPAPVNGVETDPTVADRVAGYMENFEIIYGIVEEEFGAELAPTVMDFVMDRLMGLAE